jgi:hypothetical protein
MDDFDTFKATREKMDPSSRKFSESQWQKAYAAYCSSRERVSEGRKSKSSEGSKRRRSSKGKSRHSSLSQNPIIILRSEVRQNSAYSDLRMVLDLLSWIAIGVVVLAAAMKLVYYTDTTVALASLMDAAFKVIIVVALRLLAHVIVDIPDIALRKRIFKESKSQKQPQSKE